VNEPGQQAGYGADGTKDERNVAMLAHLCGFAGLIVPLGNIVAPLIIWLLYREKSAFISDQALEALNFNITIILAGIACGVLIFVGIGILLGVALGIVWIIGTVLAAVRASEGQRYRHRFILRLVR